MFAKKTNQQNIDIMVLVCFSFPDERNVWWNDTFESITNQELSFAGPYPVAFMMPGSSLQNAVESVSEELLNSDLQMIYPYFACYMKLLISNKRHMVIDQYILK